MTPAPAPSPPLRLVTDGPADPASPPAPDSLPPLSPTDAPLIDAFIEAGADLRTLAANTGQPLRDILPWSRLPAIAPWITALTLEHARHIRATTIAYLRTITAAPESPIEGRRAASSILRCLSTPLPGSPEEALRPRERRRPPGDTGRSPRNPDLDAPASTTRVHVPKPAAPPHPAPLADPFALTSPGDGLIPVTPSDFLPHPDHPIEQVAAHVLAAIVHPDSPTPEAAAINLHNFSKDHYRDRDAAAPSRTVAEFKQATPLAFNPVDCTPGLIQRDLHPEWRSLECSIHARQTPDAPSKHLILRLDFSRHHDFAWMLAMLTTREPGIPFDAYLPPHTTWTWYNKHRRRR